MRVDPDCMLFEKLRADVKLKLHDTDPCHVLCTTQTCNHLTVGVLGYARLTSMSKFVIELDAVPEGAWRNSGFHGSPLSQTRTRTRS